MKDVAGLGAPAFMAVSELANNAVEHGANQFGSYVAVRRLSDEDGRRVLVAVADLGMGIPEHMRQQHPDLVDDGYAIARSTELLVSGTGRPHRGVGFHDVFESALTRATQEAQIDILSAGGFYRVRLCDGKRRPGVFPPANFRRGTWITCGFLSI